MMAVLGVILCIAAAFLEVLRSSCQDNIGQGINNFWCEPGFRSFAQGLAILLLALGSALIGGGITQVVAGRRAKEILEEVAETIQRSVAQPAIYSDGTKVASFRKKFYSYHQTIKDGHRLWRLTTLDFTETPAINRLLCTPLTIDEQGAPDPSYFAESFIRGSNFVTVVSPKHSEPKYLRIYPSAGLQFKDVAWGISTHMDFDQGRGIYKCLLSTTPLYGVSDPCFIAEPALIDKLENEWARSARPWGMYLCPPDATSHASSPEPS
jgi:hypothetical protein